MDKEMQWNKNDEEINVTMARKQRVKIKLDCIE